MKRLLKKYNEDKLLNYYDNLEINDKNKLREDIKKVNFKLMHTLYTNSKYDEELDMKKVSSLKVITSLSKKDKTKYTKVGENLIKKNGYGIVLLAAGNASRIGLSKPKCMLELNYKNKKISLIEIFIKELKKINKKYNVYINLYIMTNSTTDLKIKDYLEKNKYFGYDKSKIKFFIQEDLPLLDASGKILLKTKNSLWFVPNGNGNVYKSLQKHHLIKDMKRNNIKYVLFTGIDNPLTKLVDFNFIGATIANRYKIASKTIYKEKALEKDWVFCKYNNRPYMLNNNYIKYFTNVVDNNGQYLYRDKNILYHLVSIDYIEKFSYVDLVYHRAFKKYNYFDYNGNLVKPEKENAFKFEQFIFDAFYLSKDMLLYRINKDEYAPIKTKADVKKVEEILKSVTGKETE